MNGSLLDTNVITKMLNNDSDAIKLVQKIEKLYTSSIVAGELYYAAINSSRSESNLDIFRKALSYMEIVPVDDAVCMSYAEIKYDLKKKGKPIPDNDIWIAASALVHDLSIASFDKHFSEISGLKVLE